MFDQFLLRSVGEGNVLRPHIPLDLFHFHRIFRFRSLRFLCDQIEDPAGACHRVLELRNYPGDLVKRFRILICVTQEAGELSHGQRSSHHCKCACDPDTSVHKAVYKTCGRVRDRGEEGSAQRCVPEPLVDLIKSGSYILSSAERLDHLLVSNHLVDQSGLLSSRLRLEPEHVKRPLCDKVCHHKGHRSDQDYNKRDFHIDGKHKAEGAYDRGDSSKELSKSHQEAVCELIHVCNDTADHVSVWMAVNILQRQDLNLPESLVPDVSDHLISHLVIAHIHQPLCQRRDQRTDSDLKHYPEHAGEIHISL